MNFMYDSAETKEILAKLGLADVIHKLWTHTSLNKKTLINTLKLLSTFTSSCLEGKIFILLILCLISIYSDKYLI